MKKGVFALIGVFAVLLLAGSPALAQVPAGLSGTLIVLNKAGNDASFIDLATGDIVATLPTGTDPHELVVTSDGRRAIGTNFRGGNSLTVFDVANRTVARTIDLSDHPQPHGILLLPDQERVVVTTEGSNELVVVDFESGSIESAIDTGEPGSHMVALPADGARAYTTNMGSNNVSVIDLAEAATIGSFAVPQRPEAIGINRAGTEVWVGSNDEGTVTVIDPEDGSVLRQLSGFSWPYRILLTRDERHVVIPDARAEVVRVFDAASGEETGRIAFPGGGPQGVLLYPDDRTLFVALSRRGRVAVVDIDSMELLGEYTAGRGPDGLGYAMSP